MSAGAFVTKPNIAVFYSIVWKEGRLSGGAYALENNWHLAMPASYSVWAVPLDGCFLTAQNNVAHNPAARLPHNNGLSYLEVKAILLEHLMQVLHLDVLGKYMITDLYIRTAVC